MNDSDTTMKILQVINKLVSEETINRSQLKTNERAIGVFRTMSRTFKYDEEFFLIDGFRTNVCVESSVFDCDEQGAFPRPSASMLEHTNRSPLTQYIHYDIRLAELLAPNIENFHAAENRYASARDNALKRFSHRFGIKHVIHRIV